MLYCYNFAIKIVEKKCHVSEILSFNPALNKNKLVCFCLKISLKYCPRVNYHHMKIKKPDLLVSCTMMTFALSALFTKGKFQMVHIQNSTLAGGVAIGTSCNLYLHPSGAIVIGMISGIVSVWGYSSLAPILQNKFNIYDTCGINSLHGMPGILGGIFSIIAIGSAAIFGSPYMKKKI